MGGHAYWYVVPYQDDLQGALDALREREFAAGRYNPVMPFLRFDECHEVPENKGYGHGTVAAMGASVSSMASRAGSGVDMVFEVPRWSERWVLRDGVTMPESHEHRLTCELLESVVRAWAARTSLDAMVFGNVALRWDEEHPQVGVDPDVCRVEPSLPGRDVSSVRTWVEGHRAPRVAAEVVSRDTAKKDYGEGPAKYAASGTRELWVFDPERRGRGLMGGPWALQV